MKIVTKQFGEVEFDEKTIIHFKDGLLGFEKLKKYVLLSQEDSIFFWLTSIAEPEIVFPLIPTLMLFDEYPGKENYQAFSIVKLNKEPSKITANLKAPIYISHESHDGFQEIIDNDNFPIDYQLFVERED